MIKSNLDAILRRAAPRAPLQLTLGDLWDMAADRPWTEQPIVCLERVLPSAALPRRGHKVPGRTTMWSIRARCGECMGGAQERLPMGKVADDVAGCRSSLCPLWPFRFGVDPWRAEASDEKREAARRMGTARQALLRGHVQSGKNDAESADDGPPGI